MNEEEKWLDKESKWIHSCGIYGLDDGTSVMSDSELDIKDGEEKWMVS